MPFWMNWVDQSSTVAVTIISIAIMLAAGFLMTRITKLLRLPNVTAYIVGGILCGPFCLNLVPVSVVEGTAFLPDIALAFIAFSTGEFFRVSSLKKNGAKVFLVTVLESCGAALLVFLTCFFLLGLDFSFSVVLGALATATAPASTIMTIRQTGAKGDFVETLLQVVALDDVVGLVVGEPPEEVVERLAGGAVGVGVVSLAHDDGNPQAGHRKEHLRAHRVEE